MLVEGRPWSHRHRPTAVAVEEDWLGRAVDQPCALLHREPSVAPIRNLVHPMDPMIEQLPAIRPS